MKRKERGHDQVDEKRNWERPETRCTPKNKARSPRPVENGKSRERTQQKKNARLARSTSSSSDYDESQGSERTNACQKRGIERREIHRGREGLWNGIGSSVLTETQGRANSSKEEERLRGTVGSLQRKAEGTALGNRNLLRKNEENPEELYQESL